MAAPESGRWKEKPPPTKAWKGKQGRSRAILAAEQDRAAGGRNRRMVDLGDGRFARASIELKLLPRTRRIRAYLRWSDKGRSPAEYVGEVTNDTRSANLAQAWGMARAAGLIAEQEPPEDSWATSPAVRSVMQGNRGKDTKPEVRLRSLLYAEGLRYRVGIRPLSNLRRTADVVFPKARVAVFVDGCFWHGCPEHHRPATKNSEFWREKIEGNRRRDAETDSLLRDAGWQVIRVWEHEDPAEAADRIRAILPARGRAPGSGTGLQPKPTE
ncbi:very short patch repair endonuclease [Streptomyces marianii]|uniref:Very short patch repair endonuclease n=1 Tax=Streptomyces marianii TaxID=1817406 RepID=A0A5R9EE92_9ACTN|nr:very short patch repair endonuclease [Streptomyces marianii]TLQ48346.1 very short patch repair endonuclease [Streptomyces marianii]